MIIQVVVGFFATAGAAGVDFGLNSRNESDVRWGGLVGVGLAILVAGGLPLMAVAGAKALYNIPDLDFQTVIGQTAASFRRRCSVCSPWLHCPGLRLFFYRRQ